MVHLYCYSLLLSSQKEGNASLFSIHEAIHPIRQDKHFLPPLCIFSCSHGFPTFSIAITFWGRSALGQANQVLWVDSSNTSINKWDKCTQWLASEGLKAWPLPFFVLTILPCVASPRSPPKVITGDIQAQYRKRIEARHCRLNASLKSLKKKGAFLWMSSIKPPKSLNRWDETRQTVH